ncbi:MAG: 5-formyltetrahydrofolate cyclo-ligase [Nitrospirae bacterium]|nr:5-formyltetrahydrofolate cyclo-ligase [Nitrospirota bacterium]
MTVQSINAKAELRREILKRRDSIPEEVRAVKSKEIMERLIEYAPFRQAKTLLLFASFRSEIDTFPIIRHALQEGKRVLLPRVNRESQTLELYSISSLDDLVKGYMGIMEPDPERCSLSDAKGIDFILLPGAAFDLKGGRIGYGGGYYDRLLSSLERSTHLVAVAFEEQIVESVPCEEHDRRVHAIITDRRIIEV